MDPDQFSALKDPSLIKTQGFINGKWVDAKNGETIAVTNPATEEHLGTVPEMGLAETKEAIDAAAKAFETWGKTTAKVGLCDLVIMKIRF